MTTELVDAMRETPAVSPHLHVPLQSGDDQRAGRDGTALHGGGVSSTGSSVPSGFNLTTDVIVGFPAEDERRSSTDARGRGAGRDHEGSCLPLLSATRNADGRRGSVSPAAKRERSARLREASRRRCLASWRSKIGREDVVLGRPAGPRVRRRLLTLARGCTGRGARQRPWARRLGGGDPRCLTTAASSAVSSAASCPPTVVHRADGFVADRGHRAKGPGACPRASRAPRRDVTRGRRPSTKPRRSGMLEFVAETAVDAGVRGLPRDRQRRPRRRGRPSSICTGMCSGDGRFHFRDRAASSPS